MNDASRYRLTRLFRVLTHIDGRLGESMSLDELAGVACYSPYHFDRIFLRYRGISPAEHVRRRRLMRAAHRLRHEPECPIGEIAHDCGYSNQANFSRAFQQHFGMSPRTWRKGGWHDYMLRQVASYTPDIREQHADFEAQLERQPGLRATLASRITVRQLPMMRTLSRQMVGRLGYELVQACEEYTAECQQAGGLDDGALFVGSFLDDPGFTGRADFIYEFGLVEPQPVAAPAMTHEYLLPGGRYACLDWEGEMPWMRWMYEDWLDRHPDWTMDSRRPHLEFHRFSAQGSAGGTLAIPIMRKHV
ncbi:helix-turn-helix domain-containing protein [Chitinilyticum piscinae]|uniref:Helix-turn-helix domain-containing protein n=1 Tax=Chitinilyticum piscinae TaxID=2866724 RepID=A0A8J7FG34_9NEIS|nr:helix-turn-helix domain-containing protein [Chitinilyticum piscinae]MBE9608425.1 helix-turn-helix domain-containing protein [Chitinilyticum piscinae]